MLMQPNRTPLQWAARRGAVGLVEALLAAGVDISVTDASGISPAEMAAGSKLLAMRTEAADAIVQLLARAGPDAYVFPSTCRHLRLKV
jgi:ankyrin repeat protein